MKQIQIKTSKKLNDLVKQLAKLDGGDTFAGSDYFVYEENGFRGAAKLFNKAIKTNSDIYEVWHDYDCAYYIGHIDDILKRVSKALDEEKKWQEECDKRHEQEQLEKAEKELKATQKKINSLKKATKK